MYDKNNEKISTDRHIFKQLWRYASASPAAKRAAQQICLAAS